MKEKLHDKIETEIRQQNFNDLFFTIISISANFVILLINWTFSGRKTPDISERITFVFLIFCSISVTIIGIIAVILGRKIRNTLTMGMAQLYLDEGLDKYYPSDRIRNRRDRSISHIMFISISGILATVMPLILFII